MPIEIIIAVGAGLLCGFLNTVASSGSAVTLPLLIFMGLAPSIANGTNRVPVLVGALIASIAFLRAGIIDWSLAFKILTPTVIGSIFGAFLAVYMPENYIKLLIFIALICAFLLLFSGVKKLFEKELEESLRYSGLEIGILFAVGLWLGLIVLDGGTYLLLALIAFVRLPLVKANAYKNLVVLATAAIALTVFSIKDEVNWELGGIMALGSIVGAFFGAKFSLNPLAKVWTFRFLVAVIVLELIHMGMQYF
ncbi:sulfite exporter TauE/SafE family protein [Polynucleobacter arcticus]|uniref:Probable membrane transporter protein n=1 Tax=Polynucleobacter arcticus TaxID=1743165 RepID=A0A6M9PMY6_9BURK|nr:sulfite exporter TauE/SafE family protein [Polynucleobacter arcticus]QKM60147.1 hypothetical protein DN92_03315 [Polynucleobacter arcticus]